MKFLIILPVLLMIPLVYSAESVCEVTTSFETGTTEVGTGVSLCVGTTEDLSMTGFEEGQYTFDRAVFSSGQKQFKYVFLVKGIAYLTNPDGSINMTIKVFDIEGLEYKRRVETEAEKMREDYTQCLANISVMGKMEDDLTLAQAKIRMLEDYNRENVSATCLEIKNKKDLYEYMEEKQGLAGKTWGTGKWILLGALIPAFFAYVRSKSERPIA